ncbi:helix-turn-helix transcriptional regulator [Corynebacterium hindlerae]|uniref:Helix-turn-helix transcriptional regulator n=1 Tax=Corynebacterium hindlerae TaxID=699041 RepID=A0A7G5FE12_9CORY|nr:helix-turn-helix transcriptional regulator [Corynebacterium hindlerae]
MDVNELICIASEHPSRTAREAGIARSTLNRIATGKTQPSLETLQKIALTLGFDIELNVTAAAFPRIWRHQRPFCSGVGIPLGIR